jgi:hypothetical protein
MVVTGTCVMPTDYGIGDHQVFVLDFLTSSLIGHNPPTIVRGATRRLNTMICRAVRNCIGRLEDLTVKHRLLIVWGELATVQRPTRS